MKDEQNTSVTRYRWLSLASFPVGIGVFALYVYLNRFL
jgi:hypothetical protein